jgi:peptidoglycan lytic transglycosylase
MRGIVKTLSRLTAVGAVVAPAAAIALSLGIAPVAWAGPPKMDKAGISGTGSTEAASAGTNGDDVAYAVPRGQPLDGAEVALPASLEPSAAAQYRRIFALQARGDLSAANALIARLDDHTLMGPVLAARYLGPYTHSTAAELQDWLRQYGDEPAAPAIYHLLLQRLPRGATPPPAPKVSLLSDPTNDGEGTLAAPSVPESPAWRQRFALGLTDWQEGKIKAAAAVFEAAARAPAISADERATGAFWAARAALRQQDPDRYLDWLHSAASERGTFYGILAERLLGESFGTDGDALGVTGDGAPIGDLGGSLSPRSALTEADITAIDELPNGHLAFALLQVGQTQSADDALRSLGPELAGNPGLARAALAVATHAGLFDVAVAIAAQDGAAGNAIAGTTLPLPPLRPDGGFSVDPALVYALARTESGFNPHAMSPVGARGMMQLMPVTARFIARQTGLRDALGDASANLALGQSYLHYLSAQHGIDGNLLAVLASYNAGPGAAAAWYDDLRHNSDPLLFIETIPTDQTRRFVRQVLADSWIYDGELDIEPRSLDAIAEGDFPALQDYAVASN